ncbi:Signal transducer regulating beta-lactamase production, contains metallopeptidase domain [Pustulibacterium marinum]|uniref:Signal transducer regulating beta-lactamase production, contains metallopeptidase domain n=1 Tax=Pustulibacterium marinum TaxID=1224947 RepID=A0A1I7I5P5_9FLAO|nr:energy transducer TonB [Pustulibacterium marinum]SFU68257.1 Signal transducer regulating beta-lactamase production, contains metallopeptidase domain [Pustulibacterium marinum]
MLPYILLVIAGQTMFLLLYDVLLKKSTFFNSNRAYLLITSALSFVLPLLKFQFFENSVPEVIRITTYTKNETQVVLLDGITLTAKSNVSFWSQLGTWEWVFIAGCLVSLVVFSFKLYKLFKLKFGGKKVVHGTFTEIIIPKSSVAFSFFHWMFLGEKVKQKPFSHIVAHELVHIQQKHSWDLLYFEILRVVCWFNPLVYMYQNRIAELHEFIADSKTSQQNKKEHYQQLLQEVFQTENISFINQFFNHSLIKKRIVMLQKSNSKKRELLNYSFLLPTIVALLWYSSSVGQEKETANHLEEKIVVGYATEKEATSAKPTSDLKEIVVEGYAEPKTEKSVVEANPMEEVIVEGYEKPVQEKQEGVKVVGFSTEKVPVKTTKVVTMPELVVMGYPKEATAQTDSVIPFILAKVKPAFKGYENTENPTETFEERLNDHVRRVFTYPKEAQENNEQGRIQVKFQIMESGKVKVIETVGKSVLLSQEAKRIIESLPELIPAKDDNGNVITVQYAYPIVFVLAQ